MLLLSSVTLSRTFLLKERFLKNIAGYMNFPFVFLSCKFRATS